MPVQRGKRLFVLSRLGPHGQHLSHKLVKEHARHKVVQHRLDQGSRDLYAPDATPDPLGRRRGVRNGAVAQRDLLQYFNEIELLIRFGCPCKRPAFGGVCQHLPPRRHVRVCSRSE
eukprot:scaffold36089_cov59-Phaeocystis_antarctica.AAC.2